MIESSPEKVAFMQDCLLGALNKLAHKDPVCIGEMERTCFPCSAKLSAMESVKVWDDPEGEDAGLISFMSIVNYALIAAGSDQYIAEVYDGGGLHFELAQFK
jgi:hypothetical protein